LRSNCSSQKESADGAPQPETLRRRLILFAKPSESRLSAYFFGRTESFIAFPTRNFSVVFAGI